MSISVGTIIRYRYSTETWLAGLVTATYGSADPSWYSDDGDIVTPIDSDHVHIVVFTPSSATQSLPNVTEGYSVGQFQRI